MKIGDYRKQLSDLELRRSEVQALHDMHATGYAKDVLAAEIDKLNDEISELENLNVVPTPVVVRLFASPNSMALSVGGTSQLNLSARMSDGAIKDVTKANQITDYFVDYDSLFNTGLITDVDTTGYTGADNKFIVTKGSNEWLAKDTNGNPYQVAATGTANQYKLLNLSGNDIGIVFTTNGNEAVNDNWKISVSVQATGTTYESSDETIATVSADGLVTAVAVGTANITVTNGTETVTVPVTVS